MEAALRMQEVPHKAQVPCGMYQAAAVLSPGNGNTADVILMLEHPGDFVKNMPSR